MKVEDPDWLRFFGQTDSQLEPIPCKPRPAKLKKHQQQAKLIAEHPEVLGGTPHQRQLFPQEADHD